MKEGLRGWHFLSLCIIFFLPIPSLRPSLVFFLLVSTPTVNVRNDYIA